jgi:Putative Ig domain
VDRAFIRKLVIASLVSLCSLIGFFGCWGGDVPSEDASQNSDSGSPVPLAIATTSLPSATEQQAYLATMGGSGGEIPYTWLVTPPLPDGLTLDATTGEINGAPTTGTFGTTNHDFQLQDDALHSVTKRLALTVNAAGLTITTTSLPAGTVNQQYQPTSLGVTGGVQPYVWSVNTALPNGLVLNVLAPGMISGIPLDGTAGTTSQTFTVTDSSVPIQQTKSKTFSLTINLTVPPLIISTGSVLPKGKVGQPYSVTLQASGGTLPYSWSADRALPPGLVLNASTGEIAGTPTATSNISFNCTARDSTQPTNLTSSKLFNLQVTN